MAGKPGRKSKKTIEEQIAEIEDDISTYEESLNTLQKKRAELLKTKRENDLGELCDIIENNNITISEAEQVITDYIRSNRQTQLQQII